MKPILFLFTLTASLSTLAQTPSERLAVTFGILQGGGSLVGVDAEFLATDRVGLQAGAGFVGYGAALTYHLKPELRSSMVALTYWHQGAGETFTQDALGASFIYRGKKWFTAQLGLARTLREGPAWPDSQPHPPVILLYSIGAYLAT